MAREVIAWCDRHLHLQQEHVVGSEVRVGVDGQWWSTDLCDPCAKELVAPVARLLVDHGHPVVAETNAKSAQKAWAAAKGNPDAFPPTDVEPSKKLLHLHEANLERRRAGRRNGRQPTDREFMAPCIFCGIELREGGNAAHMQIHGFSTVGRALGGQCPYCGKVSGMLGSHLRNSHSNKVASNLVLTREILHAHLNKAPYDIVPALRARALNVEPLESVLRALGTVKASA